MSKLLLKIAKLVMDHHSLITKAILYIKMLFLLVRFRQPKFETLNYDNI